MTTLEQRKPNDLKNHLLSVRIYGTQRPDDDFLASVRTSGVIVPLVILPDGTVISGHRRRAAAIVAKLDSVPCLVRHDLADAPLEVERLVILSNRQRQKDGEILAREAAALAAIESALAAEREKSGLKRGPAGAKAPQREKHGENAKNEATDQGLFRDKGENAISRDFPAGAKAPQREKHGENAKNEATSKGLFTSLGETGGTRTKVARELGIGQKAAGAAIKVGKALLEAEQRGDVQTAAKLAETARTKSVHAAAKLLAPPAKKADLAPEAQDVERWLNAMRHSAEQTHEKFRRLFPAIDQLKNVSGKFRHQRHDKFVRAMRKLGDSLDVVINDIGSVTVLWADTKKLEAL